MITLLFIVVIWLSLLAVFTLGWTLGASLTRSALAGGRLDIPEDRDCTSTLEQP